VRRDILVLWLSKRQTGRIRSENRPLLRKLYLIRHGQTEWNAQERMQGRLDSGLTHLGRRQADEHGQLLRRVGVQRLLVSPLGRTTETAYIINSYVHAKIEFEEALVERHCGAWGGQTFAHIKLSQPLAWRAWQQDPWEYRLPEGENLPDVLARVEPLVSGLLNSECETVAIISHGIVGRAILAHYLAHRSAAQRCGLRPGIYGG